jgi:hypothetical protein
MAGISFTPDPLLTSQACYLKIAQANTKDVEGLSEIVNCILEEVSKGFEDQEIEISEQSKAKIQARIGMKMHNFLTHEYCLKMIEIYEKALGDLSEKEINEIVKNPTEEEDFSEAHAKFHFRVCKVFLPIKQEIIEGLIKRVTALIDEASVGEMLDIITKDTDTLPKPS